jgi:hypothetical protein
MMTEFTYLIHDVDILPMRDRVPEGYSSLINMIHTERDIAMEVMYQVWEVYKHA